MKDIRSTHVAQVQTAIFRVFGLQILTSTNRKKNAKEILQWKSSKEVQESYNKLYDDDAIEEIAKQAFPTIANSDDAELFNDICIYTVAVCDIILNPDYPDLKCFKKPLEFRYQRFKEIFKKNGQLTVNDSKLLLQEENPKKHKLEENIPEIIAENEELLEPDFSSLDNIFAD